MQNKIKTKQSVKQVKPKLEDSDIDFHINEEILRNINKDNCSKPSIDNSNSQHDSIVDMKNLKKITVKENLNNSSHNQGTKIFSSAAKLNKQKNINYMKNSQNYSTYQNSSYINSNFINNDKNARMQL